MSEVTKTFEPSPLGAHPRRLIPVVEWNKFHLWPPLGGLRHLIRHKGTNGFDHVVRLVGGRLLIDEVAFFKWVDSRAHEQGTPKE